MASSWRREDILNALQTEASNLLKNPFFEAKPADSENHSLSYNPEEQNTLREIGTFAQRYLRQTQLLRFIAKFDAISIAQEAGQDEEDGARETNYDKLKTALDLAKKETEDVSIINKDEEERAGTTSNDFSVVPVVGDAAAHPTVEVQQQQKRANLDSQNDQDEKELATSQGQLPRTLQTWK
ncbi:hypothetical protein CEP51_016797, partial [Fusarium floridanum]